MCRRKNFISFINVAIILMQTMCFVNVLSIQYQYQYQNNNNNVENSTTASIATAAAIGNNNENTQATISQSSSSSSWQPINSQNNWIILKRAARNTATETSSLSSAAAHRNHRNSHSLLTTPQLKYQYWQRKEEQQAAAASAAYQQHFPINYYIYNHNSSSSTNTGNYQQQPTRTATTTTTTDVKLIEPYIVTISKIRARTNALSPTKSQAGNAILSRRITNHDDDVVTTVDSAFHLPYAATAPAAASVNAIKLPKDVLSNVVVGDDDGETPKIAYNKQDIANMYNNNNTKNKSNFATGNSNVHLGVIGGNKNIVVDNNAQKNENIFNEIKHGDANFNGFFQPVQLALDKIITFCDMAKRFIGDVDDAAATDDDGVDDNEDVDDNNNDADTTSHNNDPFMAKITKLTKSNINEDEVQGHLKSSATAATASKKSTTALISSTSAQQQQQQQQSRASTFTSLSTSSRSIGTGRKIKKLKKKLSKFILPLLLAYKLKFLTLIPVLIGGLTLLVGTTGLAGFFFALFTAVMSLKTSSGSKSIIVKKI